jgi:hypothetical protein
MGNRPVMNKQSDGQHRGYTSERHNSREDHEKSLQSAPTLHDEVRQNGHSLKQIDPEMKLDGFGLKQALESVYCAVAANLRGRGATDAPDLYWREIPGVVFDAAIGAGWLPLADKDFDHKIGATKGDVIWEADWFITDKMNLPQWLLRHVEDATNEAEKRVRTNAQDKGWQPPVPTKFTKNQKQSIVQFNDCYVERKYLESFFALLEDIISFHMGQGTKQEENIKQLPKHTSPKERRDLLDAYIASESKKGVDITKKEIAQRADVDYSVLVKWTNGQLLDSSKAAMRISLLLLFDERNRARGYRKDISPD